MKDKNLIALIDIGSYNISIIVVKMMYKEQKMELLAFDHKGITMLVNKKE